MNPEVTRHLGCTLVARLRPASDKAAAIPIDFHFRVPSVGLDFAVSAVIPRDVLASTKDFEGCVLDLGKQAMNRALGLVMRSARIPNLDSSRLEVDLPLDPHLPAVGDEKDARIKQLEAELAELTRKYDRLALGQMGISHEGL